MVIVLALAKFFKWLIFSFNIVLFSVMYLINYLSKTPGCLGGSISITSFGFSISGLICSSDILCGVGVSPGEMYPRVSSPLVTSPEVGSPLARSPPATLPDVRFELLWEWLPSTPNPHSGTRC